MGLKTYRQKRDFRHTPEPSGHRPSASDQDRRYVIQKHAASRLHYDFRLEHGGVLKSWAVPKGPSLNPKDKRLAVQVEDHPLDYANFEGTIPEGQYGAGTVLLWDRGRWMPKSDPEEGLRKGALKFELDGEKLNGGWTLVRLRNDGRGKVNWLLIKEKDDAASTQDILKERPDSVGSGRRPEEIAAEDTGRIRYSDRPDNPATDKPDERPMSRKPASSRRETRIDPPTIPDAWKARLPGELARFERKDKKPRSVTREVPQVATLPLKQQKLSSSPGQTAASGNQSPAAQQAETLNIAGVQLTHATKVLYPGQGITKGDVARYYETVADRMLPHVTGRPLMILRCPEGHERSCFHQKHVTDSVPPHIRSVPVKEGGKTTRYLMVHDKAGLIALVQMGTLEVHVWGSQAKRLEYPDRLIFDLDPDVGIPWRRVIEGARLLRDRLAGLGLKSWVKTTGGKGLHVVVPLVPKQEWPTVRAFARTVAEMAVRDSPDGFTSRLAKAHRTGKIFIDYLRNGRGATAVATYSTRARAGAPVSWPAAWEELGRIDPQQFTVRTAPRHLAKRKADPWKGFASTRQAITQAMLRKLGLA